MNDSIYNLIFTSIDEGISYTDTFPITRGAPFAYSSNMTNTQRRWLDAYIDFHSALYPEISAPDLIAWMRGHYGIDYTIGISAARLIMGVRWEMEMRNIIGTITPYIFARDVNSHYILLLEEQGLVGVNVESTFIREYHTTYAAHLLGYIGPIPQGRVDFYRERGYPMDALVGITGIELAFEEELRGVPGRQIIRTLADGTIVDIETPVGSEPIPGQHVYLSIDIGLQIAAENALRTQVDFINAQREDEEDRIPGGAVVVTDVNTGEVLASASYPTFNPNTRIQDWSLLATDEREPLLNRALHGRYIPGSTFKMVTGFAGLRNGAITRHYPFDCSGVFRWFEHIGEGGNTANCWIFTNVRVGHRWLDIVPALEQSCNYFFLATASSLRWYEDVENEEGEVVQTLRTGSTGGAEILGEAARDFGLGLPTGIEMSENTGFLSTPTNRRDAGRGGWWVMDTALTGFGQGDNRFTPLQLANYTATIANGGTLYDLTILRRIQSSDFSETIRTHVPQVRHVVAGAEHLESIQQGMLAASRGNQGTAWRVFRNYPIPVASKTGTAQVEGRDTNDGIFVAYAPANAPEIAVALVVEKGGSGSAVMDISRMIFDYYFRGESSVLAVPYGQLIP
jgi:penicillin-binding protein 2